MKQNVNRKKYANIDDAVAFRIAFAPFVYTYGDIAMCEYYNEAASCCGKKEQKADFLTPRGPCSKMDRGILATYDYGVSIAVRDLLIENFADISQDDFRPCRNKTGDIVFCQITPRHVMQPMAEQLGWQKIEQCDQCGSVQYEDVSFHNELGNPYYYITEAALTDLHSLNITYERFMGHYPRWIISRDVYDFLIERYPRMEFYPMFLHK